LGLPDQLYQVNRIFIETVAEYDKVYGIVLCWAGRPPHNDYFQFGLSFRVRDVDGKMSLDDSVEADF
jgi:hypothetical protein